MNTNRYGISYEGIITKDEIKQIIERYRIGKKPLAKLLGWGETTIIRYLEGDIPTMEYSNKLKAILNDPEFYYDILCKRRDTLTNVAFKKSKKAVISSILSSKIHAVAYYIVNKSDAEICASYIQYMLYYIQAFSLALYDKEMFEEEYGVNSNYIPYERLYEQMKINGIHTLDIPEGYLTQEEKFLIDAIYDVLGWYGPRALKLLNDYEKSMAKISRDKCNNKIISKNAIKSYFKEVVMKYHISEINDAANYFNDKVLELKSRKV